MMRLDDFLDPLFEGRREVIVSKSELPDHPGPGWTESTMSVPTPGMIASYRKGPIHVREFSNEYRAHLDRYDPKKHPLLHVIDDAPLLLMLWGTVKALSKEAVDAARGETAERLAALKDTYKSRMLVGTSVLLLGIAMVFFPIENAQLLFRLIIPLGVTLIGVLTIFLALTGRRWGKTLGAGSGALMVGLGVGLIAFWQFEALIILLVLSAWLIASAVLSLGEYLHLVGGPRKARRGLLGIGLLSLVIGVAILFVPASTLPLLMSALGIVVLLTGASMIMTAFGLRRASMVMKWDD